MLGQGTQRKEKKRELRWMSEGRQVHRGWERGKAYPKGAGGGDSRAKSRVGSRRSWQDGGWLGHLNIWGKVVGKGKRSC